MAVDDNIVYRIIYYSNKNGVTQIDTRIVFVRRTRSFDFLVSLAQIRETLQIVPDGVERFLTSIVIVAPEHRAFQTKK